MSLHQRFYFALRLAWRQLTHERGKLIAALLGVMFACVLVFMQLGFKDSLYESISTVVKRLSGDIFIMHKQTEALWRTVPFERSEMLRAFASPAVASATPLYIGQAQWKNPDTRTKRTLLVWGSEPTEMLFKITELKPYAYALTRQDTAAFDELSRPEFGPVKDMLAKGPVIAEINDRKMEVVTTFKLGASFAADGNMVTSDQNFFRIFPNRNMDQVDVGVIRLKPGSDVLAVQNSVSPREIGVGTSSVTFFRQLGGSVGTAVFGTILTARLATELAAAIPPQLAGSIKTNQQYRGATGLPLRNDKQSYEWCLDYKQMSKRCIMSTGSRERTKEEMMGISRLD